ncbi:hypothetical protein VTL71DRAFT_5233 [Oculimacula yallundae]|uniref:Small nuclear ribonucleoprotein G n=1 Tax=Oculimacula yallundae TaxID=86028 RepID=A0ABR4C314_9HELO
MPQAQPELKKVCSPVPESYAASAFRGARRTVEKRNAYYFGYDYCIERVPNPISQYLDKRLFVQLNGSRKVIGVLRGYDVFLNIVLDDAVEEKDGGEKVRLGMVVIRGNSVVMLEALERIGGGQREQRERD